MKSSRGFTLIELIIVITILGILAAVALPRFVDIQRDARIAKLQAARGAVNAAAAIARSAMLVRGGVADPVTCAAGGGIANNTIGGAGTLCTDAGVIATQNGWPASVALGTAPPGIHSAAGLTTIFNPSAANLTAEGYTVTVAAPLTTIQITGAPNLATCQFTYTHSAAAGAGPVVSAVATGGC